LTVAESMYNYLISSSSSSSKSSTSRVIARSICLSDFDIFVSGKHRKNKVSI